MSRRFHNLIAAFALPGAVLSGLWLISAPAALAATTAPYTQAAFATAMANHTPVLIHIEASWCPTCAQQKRVLKGLETAPRYASLEIFDVDFDAQKPVVQQFGATMQSTLIAFHDGKETRRAVGITSKSDIETLLDAAVQG
jgi:thioredoxin-like negative regulator of GroEL